MTVTSDSTCLIGLCSVEALLATQIINEMEAVVFRASLLSNKMK